MRVVIGIIYENKKVLITRRSYETSHGGKWEFPGGKIEPDEEIINGLTREIREEIGLEIKNPIFLGEVNHTYEVQTIHLYVYLIENFTGLPQCCESQLDLRWISINELSDYEFPEANEKVIALFLDSIWHRPGQYGSWWRRDLLVSTPP